MQTLLRPLLRRSQRVLEHTCSGHRWSQTLPPTNPLQHYWDYSWAEVPHDMNLLPLTMSSFHQAANIYLPTYSPPCQAETPETVPLGSATAPQRLFRCVDMLLILWGKHH